MFLLCKSNPKGMFLLCKSKLCVNVLSLINSSIIFVFNRKGAKRIPFGLLQRFPCCAQGLRTFPYGCAQGLRTFPYGRTLIFVFPKVTIMCCFFNMMSVMVSSLNIFLYLFNVLLNQFLILQPQSL